MRVPKLRRVGASTAGPPISVHVSRSRCVSSSIVHAISMRPPGTDSAPNFVVLVQSSLNVIASAITAPDVMPISGPSIEKSSGALGVIGFGRAANGGHKAGIGPADLHQQIVRAPERDQPALDGLLPVLDAGRGSQALRRDGAHGRERILDAMMQFIENELLQLVRGLALLGVDAGLREQGLGVDDGLFQQQPKAVVLGGQELLRGGAGRAVRGLCP